MRQIGNGMEEKRIRVRRNNRGAALVTVIIIILFMTIIVSTLLYVSSMGYRVRAEDRSTRVSFYDAEVPIELIQQDVIILASEAIRQAYLDTVQEYANLSPQERQTMFYTEFSAVLTELWTIYANNGGKVPSDRGNGSGTFPAGAETLKDRVSTLTGFDLVDAESGAVAPYYVLRPLADISVTEYKMMEDADPTNPVGNDSLILSGFTIHAVTEGGFRTVIQTDICVTLPPINWEEGKNPLVLDSVSESYDADFAGYNITDYVYYVNWSRQ